MLELLLNLVKHMEGDTEEEAPDLEEEYIYQYFTQIKRLKEVLTARQLDIELPTFWRLFRQVAERMRLPFSGEPIRGLQLMGILESRNLDFETVFILSMNEASFPPRHQTDSFIPFNLRKGYGMPLPEHYDAMYAYYFYRLFHKSKRVFILHNTQNSSQLSGELSRLVQQLRFESGFSISEQVLSHEIRAVEPKPIVIPKNKAVQEELSKYTLGLQGKSLTPSALNMYMDCPVKFYFQQVAGLRELDEVNEEIDPSVFGNLLHRVLELLYKELAAHKKSYEVHPDDFKLLRAAVDGVIVKAFKKEFKTGQGEEFEFEGRNLIIRDIIKEYTDKALDWDEAYAPFTIEGLEANEKQGFRLDFPIQVGQQGEQYVSLKGTIDRIDRKEFTIRVLDYKSGSDGMQFESIASLFDPASDKRNKAAMQVLFYGMLYAERQGADPFADVHAGLVLIKKLVDINFDYRLESKENSKPQRVDDVSGLMPDYKAHLRRLLEEIFNPEIPFDQTTDHKKCSYCAYADICHRS
jgi:CRISPR/Cas system-associated exonuclease Cas4 (RecB family)